MVQKKITTQLLKSLKNKYLYVTIAIIAISIPILYLISRESISSDKKYELIVTNSTNNQIKLNVEKAQSYSELEKGLMNRTFLDKNSGMIFIFRSPQVLQFWMKNTLIPLDIIFVDSDFRIINIEQAEPCSDSTGKTCSSYYSARQAIYAIEANKGWSKDNNVNPGDLIDTKNL
jgi:uncharacterized membrane protein (UPF0127 family)